MTNKTCNRCKHYTPNQWQDDPMWKNAGHCALIDDSGNHADKVSADRVAAWDYEGYSAGAYVGPKFGCIHWEAK